MAPPPTCACGDGLMWPGEPSIATLPVVSLDLMGNVRDQINAHLYPVLATVATVFLGIGMISTLKANHKLGVIAEQAALFNSCVAVHLEENPNYVPDEVVSHCNGGPEPGVF